VKRPLRPEELRLWSAVAATIHPHPGRTVPKAPAEAPVAKASKDDPPARIPVAAKAAKGPAPRPRPDPADIEPGRRHRIARERDPIGARLDLHGLDQDRARATLEGFLRRAWDDGYRAVLVITGKGTRGDGVLRRYAPEWMAAPPLRDIVAGISEAHRRHGGEGALYVALKRKPRS